MVFVFGSFILESDRTVKLMGAGLASAILLDATIVRLLLVPATMELLGDRNWWLPPAAEDGGCRARRSGVLQARHRR
jgi:RND superfamily putative drug exporter